MPHFVIMFLTKSTYFLFGVEGGGVLIFLSSRGGLIGKGGLLERGLLEMGAY